MAKKKRYHQSVKDRMAESRGMERYETKKKMKKRDDEGYYGPESRMEYQESHMIQEDRNAVANLPQHAMMKQYPKMPYADYKIDDTIGGIDYQMYEDSDERKKNQYKTNRFPEKY